MLNVYSWTTIDKFETHRHRRERHYPNDLALFQLTKESRPDWKTDDRLVEHQLERERENFMKLKLSIYDHVWSYIYSFVRVP